MNKTKEYSIVIILEPLRICSFKYPISIGNVVNELRTELNSGVNNSGAVGMIELNKIFLKYGLDSPKFPEDLKDIRIQYVEIYQILDKS